MYSYKEKKQAVETYFKMNSLRAIRKTLGYPAKNTLISWIKEFKEIGTFTETFTLSPKYTEEQREYAIELSMHEDSADTIANKYDVDRTSLYNWKHILLPDKEKKPMDSKVENSNHKKSSVDELKNKLAQMQKEYDDLAKKTYRMKLEYDALEAASEIIKKDQGITLK